MRWATVASRPSAFVAMFRDSMLDDHLRHGTLAGARMIYSMWGGYLQEERNRRVVEEVEAAGGSVVSLRAGGHAYPGDLRRLVEALGPKVVVPMHTLAPGQYEMLGVAPTQIGDGQALEICDHP